MCGRLNRLFLAVALLVSLFAAFPSLAAQYPSQVVAGFLEDAFRLFRSEAITEDERRAALRRLFAARMDIPGMAHFTTMDRLKEAPPEARQRFEQLMVGYLVNTFYAQIAKGAPGKFDVSKPRPSLVSESLTVKSVIRTPGSPPEPIIWRLRPADGTYKIIDVVSEGVSLATSHRAAFAAVLLQGGLPRLEQMLAERQ